MKIEKTARKRNPLKHRYLRSLRSEFGKYLVIFLLLTFTIGLISGFLVADGSMIIAYRESFEKYNIEDGNFRTDEEISRTNRRDIEAYRVTLSSRSYSIRLYDNFYVEKRMEDGNTLRLFQFRDEINRLCLMDGSFPEKQGDLVLDRMFAENNGIRIGDSIRFGRYDFTVTGLVAFPDYSALFQDNSDAMFDALRFGVAAVGKEDFARFHADELTYCYSWKYVPAEYAEEEKILSDRIMEDIADEIYLEDFLPRYLNQAIQFTGEDMGGDRAMMLILLYIVIVIIAFVFVITMNDTIAREAAVIGTLRASGFTRSELVRHYMALPLIVTLAAALAGNILGYTYFKDVCAGMYYGSYSLPTYVTVWNAEAFVLTTIVPFCIMLVTTFLTLRSRLSLSPLQFLRKDLRPQRDGRKETGRRTAGLCLSPRIPFPVRFRLRIFFQNIGNYAILFIGILFANLLLLFGMALPAVLDRYQASMRDNMLCEYQYFLNIPAYKKDRDYEFDKILTSTFLRLSSMTSEKSAEAFTSYTLRIPEGEALRVENITVYGIKKDSSYIDAPIARGETWISAAYADKCRIHTGDTIRLKEPFEDKTYTFTVDGIYDYMGGLCMFMRTEDLCSTFGLFDDYTSGYFSDQPITDISRDMIATVVDYDDLVKISRQLDISMGGMMIVVDIFAVVLFMILLYLLSRIVIEKNAHAISMTKILGCTDREIAGFYMLTTTIATLLMLAVTIPADNAIMHTIFQYYLAARMTGWITYDIPRGIFLKMFLLGAATYLAVAILELRKIRAIPMTDALKDVM
ncbi:MAG: ABC transporter permease [Lachnospiraceae bacterium]|nr:ABC transporter permease [Lachnospiraceae bacterium]